MDELDYIRCENEFTYKGRQFSAYTTLEQLEETCKFEFLPTDIIVSTFTRSGTTFTQEIVWQIKNRKTVVRGEKVANTMARSPFIEFNYKFYPHRSKSFAEVLNSQKEDPYRLIKTHVPFEYIRDNFEKVNPKMIVVMRNAKDCFVSNYHFYKHPVFGWKGTFDNLFAAFLHDKSFIGSYFDDNLEWWSLRERENILILFYEDLVLDLPKNVEKIARFLDEEKLTEEELDKIVFNCSFETVSKNPAINFPFGSSSSFLRKGIIGDWKEHFMEEQNKMLDDKIASKFNDVGLEFIYE